jgi:hypothetical protein
MRIDMSNKTMSMSSIEDREVIDLTMSPEVNEKQEITSRKGAPVKSTKRVTFVNLAGDEGDNNDKLTLLRSSNIVNFIPFDNTLPLRQSCDFTVGDDTDDVLPRCESNMAKRAISPVDSDDGTDKEDILPVRKSRRVTTDIGWVDSHKLSSVDDIIENLLVTETEYNLFVTPEGDCRHAFVVRKSLTEKSYWFYDYQGRYFLRDPNFVTSVVYKELKKRAKSWKVLFGQKNEIFGDDNAHLCMKNSAYVMKYKTAPLDDHFKQSWPGDDKAPTRLTRAYRASSTDLDPHAVDFAERKIEFERWMKQRRYETDN